MRATPGPGRPGGRWARHGVGHELGPARLLGLDPDDGSVVRPTWTRPIDDLGVGAGAIWDQRSVGPRARDRPRAWHDPHVHPDRRPARALQARADRHGNRRGRGLGVERQRTEPHANRPEACGGHGHDPARGGQQPDCDHPRPGAVWVALSGDGAVARVDERRRGSSDPRWRSRRRGGGARRVFVSVQPGFRAGLARRGREVQVPGAIRRTFARQSSSPGKHPAPRDRLRLPVAGAKEPPAAALIHRLSPLRARSARVRGEGYRVGYQSCDDSNVRAREPFPPRRPPRPAGATLERMCCSAVVGVIGSYLIRTARPLRSDPGWRSGHSRQIGVSDGRRPHPRRSGALPGEPRRYYPSGVRNFARVVAADDVQGAAAVVMAAAGRQRLFVLDDGEPYGAGLAQTVRGSGGQLGVGGRRLLAVGLPRAPRKLAKPGSSVPRPTVSSWAGTSG